MNDFISILQDVWREACRHIEIGESIGRIAPVLVQRMPLDLMLVRRIDLERSCVETLATGVAGRHRPPGSARSDCSAEALERLLQWCRRGEVVRGDVQEVQQKCEALVPEGLTGDVLAGPLVGEQEGEPIGVLVLVAHPPHAFSAEHEPMAEALLEPMSVALQNDRRLRELTRLREAVEADKEALLSRLGRQDISDSIVGAETGLRGVMERVELVARSDAPVLILGETGSGKEVVARAIHTRSRRADGPFLRVNCGAIPPELVDSDLFGHERGSFTGAVAMRKGWFERADGGTLFLDEVAELPLAAQVRLLRIVQDGSYERVGGQRTQTVDVRIVAATHRDLQNMVAQGRFREDLWYRVAVFPIRLPPLRERAEDIPAMAAHFALRAAKRLGTPPLIPTPEDNRLLVAYSWPGNIRELAAVLERAAILGDGRRLEIAKALGAMGLPPSGGNGGPAKPQADGGFAKPQAEGRPAVQHPVVTVPPLSTLDDALRRHIEAALACTNGRIEGPSGAARLLGVNPYTLRGKMRKLGIDWKRFRNVDLARVIQNGGFLWDGI